MYQQLRLIFILIVILLIPSSKGYGKDTKDSAINALSGITKAYQKGVISGRDFLDSTFSGVQVIMSSNIKLDNVELLKLLEPFRQLAWRDKNFEDYRRSYYALLSNYAQASARYGEMLYYAEKLDKIEHKDNKRPSLSASTIIADYYMTHRAYAKVCSLFAKEKDYLLSIPNRETGDSTKITNLIQAVILLSKYIEAFYLLSDSNAASEATAAMDGIAAMVSAKAETHEDKDIFIANVAYLRNRVLYHRAVAIGDKMMQQQAFGQMQWLQSDSATPEYLKNYIIVTLVDWKVSYYQKYNDADSLNHYLDVYEQLIEDEGIPYNQYLLKRSRAEALYKAGRYQESADMMQAATEILDSSRSALVKDIDDMLYAGAKAEEQQLLLEDAKKKGLGKDRVIKMILAGTLLLLAIGIVLIWYTRQRQRRRFLEFKLNMARNIHDEVGPALLYAKSLALTNRLAAGEVTVKSEMELHLAHTLEVVRSLSHDLKSDELYTIEDLVTTIRNGLKKLNGNNDFSIIIQEKISVNRFLSHYQYSNLKAILQECITNTIKHASFDTINIQFLTNGNKLTIIYSDNGKGWPLNETDAGIGMKNMAERSRNVNGDFDIVNNYPQGYTLGLNILLR